MRDYLGRKGQYTLIIFIIATIILLSLMGIVSEVITDKAEQIEKTQLLMQLGDRVKAARSIQNQERQVGVDFTSVHLGVLGGWPRGNSECGSIRDDTPSWLFKEVPYWYSGSGTANYYAYTVSSSCNELLIECINECSNDIKCEQECEITPNDCIYGETSTFTVYQLGNVVSGYYTFPSTPFILDGEVINASPVFLEAGTHRVIYGDICSHTLSDCNYQPTIKPEELIINRVITQENCFPDNEFIRELYQQFINTYFKTMSELAFQQMKSVTAGEGFSFDLLTSIDYEAEINSLGTNSIFITFYSVNIPLISFAYRGFNDDLLTNASITHQTFGTTYDAYRSDFMTFKTIGDELINEGVINDLFNQITSKHSSFNIMLTMPVIGSAYPAYESLIPGWNAVSPNLEEININIDKPHCIYYLRESCIFLNDEITTGYKGGDYNKNSKELYNDFTKNHLPSSWQDKTESCNECYQLGKFNNPCTNIQDPACIDCFNSIAGQDYYVAEDDHCKSLIDRDIKPLLNEYLAYRFNDLEKQLQEKYNQDFKLDSRRINITSISFQGVVTGDTGFNSTCNDCRSVSVSNCDFLKSDLKLQTGILIGWNDEKQNYIQSDASGFIELSDSEKKINMLLTVVNTGNTKENIKLTLLIQGFSDTAPNNEPTGQTLISNINSFNHKKTIELSEINPGQTITFNKELFAPSDYEFNRDSHFMRACIHSNYNDEWDLSDNCIDLRFGVCTDGDLSSSCCDGAGGTWLNVGVINYGACCGDDIKIFNPLSAGRYHNCVLLNNNNINCWGSISQGYTGGDAISTSLGIEHNCALLNTGDVTCWGNNNDGQSNNYTEGNAVALSSGMNHNCVLKNDGRIFCWGQNNYGQTNVPSGLNNVIAVSVGLVHNCALRIDGTVTCWSSWNWAYANPYTGSDVIAVSAGTDHTCALRNDGTVVCWGRNLVGQGNVPSGLNNIIAVSAGGYHTCALRNDGTVTCWGSNVQGQSSVPSGLTNVIAVSAGETHTCALKSDGNVVCWGSNSQGYTEGNALTFSLDHYSNYLKDYFMASPSKICYYGKVFNCPADAPIAARVRSAENARKYDSIRINYYCIGQ